MFLPPSSSGGNQERITDVLVTLDTVRFRGADGGPNVYNLPYHVVHIENVYCHNIL